MKVRWMLAVAMAGAVHAAQAQAPAGTNPPPSAPKLQFDNVVYDFGSTTQVQSVTGTFTFQNTGSATLQIQKPSPTCGCTVAAVKPETLQPGEKGELVFTLSVANLRGPAEKHIIVPSNDPQTPSVNLSIKINVVPTFDVQPPQVSFGDLRQGTITNVALRVKRTDGRPLVINRVESSGKFVRTRIEPVEASNGSEAIVWLEAEMEGIPRRLNDLVRVYVDGAPQQPTMVVPVFARLVGDFTVTPEQLYWGVPSDLQWQANEQLTTRRMMVSGTDQSKPIVLSNVVSSIKELNCDVVPVEAGRTYMIVAKLADRPQASTSGTISVDTNQPDEPKLVVPVTVNIIGQMPPR